MTMVRMEAELKKNLLRIIWWKAMVAKHENIVGIDAAIFMAPNTGSASVINRCIPTIHDDN